jgi:hypothetical protein
MRRSSFVIAAGLAALSPASARADQCQPTANDKAAHIVAFAQQPPAWQSDILDLSFGSKDRPLLPAPGVPVLAGDPKARYLAIRHPHPEPMPPPAAWCRYVGVALPADRRIPTQAAPSATAGGGPRIIPPATIDTTFVLTPEGIFPAVSHPAQQPPGTNLLPTIEHDVYDGNDVLMPNTLPSTKTRPYNLHDGPPVVTVINATSPADDLRAVLDRSFALLTERSYISLAEARDDQLAAITRDLASPANDPSAIDSNKGLLTYLLRTAIDIIEGRSGPDSRVPGDRAYRGFALLHHSGQDRVGCVQPVYDATGKVVVGGTLPVHQIWYDNDIQSDTMFVDFGWGGETVRCGKTGVPAIPPDVPWTVTFTIDVLNRGSDDFAPAAIYYDAPKPPALPPSLQPLVGMDQSFFPMQDGTRTVLTIKMAPAKYFFSTYTWGWRAHPPRAQAMENAHVTLDGTTVVDDERKVFGSGDPIVPLSDLAPAKRMWRAFKAALAAADAGDYGRCLNALTQARDAYQDWGDRNHLPGGIQPDPASDLTLLFVNNTIYGQIREGGWTQLPQWSQRGDVLRVTLINGDYFEHGYVSVDFGGNRGWENQLQATLKTGGSGTFFTFGRFYWSTNTVPGTIAVPPAKPVDAAGHEIAAGTEAAAVIPGVHRVVMQMDFEPSRRLRMYQFDPMHHDVAIYSMH